MSNNFYVYIYLDPSKPGVYTYENFVTFFFEPFYVGKGSNGRLYAHLEPKLLNKDKNRHKRNKIKKISKEYDIKKYILKLNTNNEYVISNCFEPYLIQIIGRKDLKKGPLTNLTDGSEGVKGVKSKKFQKACKKRAENAKGTRVLHNESENIRVKPEDVEKYLSLGYKLGWPKHILDKHYKKPKGSTQSEELKLKISNSMKGKQNTLGKIFVTDTIIEKCINKEELEYYLSLGFKRGRLKHTYETIEKLKIINKENANKRKLNSDPISHD